VTEVTVPNVSISQAVEQVLIGGDLSKLSAEDRVRYYNAVCRSLGLNSLTQPFAYIVLNNKLTLYAKRDCTDQLRKINKVSIAGLVRERHDDVYVVTASAETPDGRRDESIGAVSIAGLKGDALANALMKAETKAKRRVTLSIVGLGLLDESEVSSVPDAQMVTVNGDGEIVEQKKLPPARPEPTNDNGKPEPPNELDKAAPRLARRAQLEGRYQDIIGQMRARGLAAEDLDPNWSLDVLVEKGSAAGRELANDMKKDYVRVSSG